MVTLSGFPTIANWSGNEKNSGRRRWPHQAQNKVSFFLDYKYKFYFINKCWFDSYPDDIIDYNKTSNLRTPVMSKLHLMFNLCKILKCAFNKRSCKNYFKCFSPQVCCILCKHRFLVTLQSVLHYSGLALATSYLQSNLSRNICHLGTVWGLFGSPNSFGGLPNEWRKISATAQLLLIRLNAQSRDHWPL